jgi:all-trans-retinol 13,14-reductase
VRDPRVIPDAAEDGSGASRAPAGSIRTRIMMWDTLVLGSGIGGLTAAAALARRGRSVLVIEQHHTAGGLTQTFTRQGWTFAPGVHYLGNVGPQSGPDGQFGRLLGWLSGGALRFADCGNPYDIVRLPGVEFGVEHPESAYRARLRDRFPAQHTAIDHWFDEMAEARRAAMTLFAMRGLPAPLAWGLKLWRGHEVQRMSTRTLAEALADVSDPTLRAVLGARWADYGAPPAQAPLLEHALVTGSYNAGSYYPVGGPARFAQTLVPVITDAGGDVLVGASVERILIEDGRACGVVYIQGGLRHEVRARHVISAMGVVNTAAAIDAAQCRDWHAELRGFEPGLSYLSLFLGFEGDITAAGASAANVWIYESLDIGRVWTHPADEDAPGLFVSFPSLKDPTPGRAPTAEVLALCDGEPFARWQQGADETRPEDYLAFKSWIEARMLAQFERHFPALAPMIRFHELSTPLTQRHFTRSPDGAMYGIEMDAERLGSTALNVRTPVPGLLLAGQDVAGAGVEAAAMSGLMAAIALEPGLVSVLAKG